MVVHRAQSVTFYNFLYVCSFNLFQLYSKQFLGLVTCGLLENIKHYLLIKKSVLILGIIEKKLLKYCEACFFWDTC